MGRGLPGQVAEDVVFAAWEAASASFDPRKGSFEAYMQGIVRNGCAQYWRKSARRERAAAALRLLPSVSESEEQERAAAKQVALMDALGAEERKVFSAWALQKHLGKGRISAAEVGASIGLDPREFENAKRRLQGQLHKLLDRFGWTVADVIHGGRDVDQTG